LEPGERILGLEDEWLLMEGVTDGGRVTTVYNFRVADWHTYFVGTDEWGFSVWAHNAAYGFWGASNVNPNLANRLPGGPTNGLLNDTIPLMSGRGGGLGRRSNSGFPRGRTSGRHNDSKWV